MAVANAQAYYNMAKITDLKSCIAQAPDVYKQNVILVFTTNVVFIKAIFNFSVISSRGPYYKLFYSCYWFSEVS
jgi:hypothetical protein